MIIEDILRKCLLCGSPFCLYRLPGESEGHFLYSGKVSVLDSLEEIGNDGFLFTPFVATEECKRLYINFLQFSMQIKIIFWISLFQKNML